MDKKEGAVSAGLAAARAEKQRSREVASIVPPPEPSSNRVVTWFVTATCEVPSRQHGEQRPHARATHDRAQGAPCTPRSAAHLQIKGLGIVLEKRRLLPEQVGALPALALKLLREKGP